MKQSGDGGKRRYRARSVVQVLDDAFSERRRKYCAHCQPDAVLEIVLPVARTPEMRVLLMKSQGEVS